MMKRQLFLVLFLLFFTAGSFTSTACAAGKGFYPDGQLKWEHFFEGGVISEAKWYDEAGQMTSRETYVAGKADITEGFRADGSLEWRVKQLEEGRQEVSRFNEGGQIIARYQAFEGQPEGEYTTFYDDGQQKQKVTYSQGALNGPAATFFASGQVEHEFAYSNGEVDGVYRTYSEEGSLLTEYTFSNGQLQ